MDEAANKIGGCLGGVSFAEFSRPIDPQAEPVTIPKFSSFVEVQAFYREHNRALTWAQMDELTAAYDELNAAIEKPTRKPEDVLADAWKEACRQTKDDGERKRLLADVAARVLGADGPMQCRRVLDLYNRVGVRPVNRAILELVTENMLPGDRFRYLEHRAKLQKESKSA